MGVGLSEEGERGVPGRNALSTACQARRHQIVITSEINIRQRENFAKLLIPLDKHHTLKF